jgi:adenosyl cobinamide kinase/adenosyl cobinamide phosphate guanylyltransferase
MSLVLLLGGARSGKSALALELAQRTGSPVAFVATGEALDDEMATRIARHRAERPAAWTTVEAPLDLQGALTRLEAGTTCVVDCLSLWVSNLVVRGDLDDDIVAAASAAATLAHARTGFTVAVSNEVGLGVVPASPLGRRYRDVLGLVNRAWADAASHSYLVVAGRALALGAPEVPA